MSKKNRAKSKAKRFGEGSAKPIVSAATYGVGGNTALPYWDNGVSAGYSPFSYRCGAM